mgnify:CR=1 FL=1
MKPNVLNKRKSTKVKQKKKLISFLSRPHISFEDLKISKQLSDFIKKLQDIEKNFSDYLDIVNYGNQNYLKYAKI